MEIIYNLFHITGPLGIFRQNISKFMTAGRREGELFRTIHFLENYDNKLLLFNFIVECKGKKLRTHSVEPLLGGLTFFQLSCPLSCSGCSMQRPIGLYQLWRFHNAVTDFTLTISTFLSKYDILTCNFDNCGNCWKLLNKLTKVVITQLLSHLQ